MRKRWLRLRARGLVLELDTRWICACFYWGGFWVRASTSGRGFAVMDREINPALFSVRNGHVPERRIWRWGFRWLHGESWRGA